MEHLSLGTRMKENYENRNKAYLIRRMPVIIRLDGCHFHTFTRFMRKPFDEFLIKAMQETTKYLCENIQGCKLGYIQSDEISLLLTDYDKLETEAWFNYQVQKMCSVSASITSTFFNNYVNTYCSQIEESDIGRFYSKINAEYGLNEEAISDVDIYRDAGFAFFDSRCFNIPKEEVNNYFLWRQRDASKNSIQAVAQSLFSHNQLQGLNCNELQNKMLTEKNVNWNNLSTDKKRGACIIKTEEGWTIDREIPFFDKDKNYIERFI